MTAVRDIEHFTISLADGTRLAARMWLPDDAESRPVPAILEYIPYRKRDGTRSRDEPMHGWFAAQGYAAIRVDMRGSGESDGLLEDEYLQRELDDACEVIAWIASQRWCTGAVGMMGKSWGGFNCLQVAALRPPALKAVLTALPGTAMSLSGYRTNPGQVTRLHTGPAPVMEMVCHVPRTPTLSCHPC